LRFSARFLGAGNTGAAANDHGTDRGRARNTLFRGDHNSAFGLRSNGARLNCAYLENDRDAENYQGWSLTRVYVEELTQFPMPDPVFKLLATLRSSKNIKPQMRCTCNPGGAGHGWVKEWIIDHGEYELVTDPESGLQRTFIPAKLADNPALLDVTQTMSTDYEPLAHLVSSCVVARRLDGH
jgi:hypothetical protein